MMNSILQLFILQINIYQEKLKMYSNQIFENIALFYSSYLVSEKTVFIQRNIFCYNFNQFLMLIKLEKKNVPYSIFAYADKIIVVIITAF